MPNRLPTKVAALHGFCKDGMPLLIVVGRGHVACVPRFRRPPPISRGWNRQIRDLPASVRDRRLATRFDSARPDLRLCLLSPERAATWMRSATSSHTL